MIRDSHSTLTFRYPAVILLDELEKAHKVNLIRHALSWLKSLTFGPQDVAMILLQILDEGSITDSQGRKVDFKVCLFVSSETSGD